MAEFEMRNGQGSIFKNDKKGNEKAPDYSGKAMIHDKEVKIALWVKEGAKGKFFSVKIEDANTQQSGGGNRARPAANEDDGSDLPF